MHLISETSTPAISQGAILSHTGENADFKLVYKARHRVNNSAAVLSEILEKNEVLKNILNCVIADKKLFYQSNTFYIL